MRVLIVLLIAVAVQASEVEWNRLKGTLKAINHKTGVVSLQDKDGDLLKLKLDGDVTIVRGKDEVKATDLRIDDKVTLLYNPKAQPVADPDEPTMGSVYPSLKK
jgi:hypothetical protein